ncbi:MAG: zinc transporter ZupT [Planctomycetota bacterium]
MEGSRIGIALLLTAGAGLSTTIGSVLGLAVKEPGPKFTGFTLGFSAGVMILVSFVELLRGAMESVGFMAAHVAFFLGMTGIFLIDFFVPHEYIGQHDHPLDKTEDQSKSGLMRTGSLVAFGIGIHNFPEGMATFAGTLEDVSVGVAIAVAIAIHNIPEGLAVAAPIYAATGSRGKAFLWSFLSGVSEPVGAGLAALVLMPILTPTVLAWVLGGVAGIMVAISVDELVPAAKSYGSEHTPIMGVIAGMFVMALSLWMLK